MKSSELIGPALDWAVAKSAGNAQAKQTRLSMRFKWEINRIPHYSTDWACGGSFIESEKIDVWVYGTQWAACSRFDGTQRYGPTPLIAVMRCYVASKLGDEIAIPEELQ